MVIVFPYGTCAICDAGLPPGRRPSRPRTICDQRECRLEANRYGARLLNVRNARRQATRPPKTSHRCARCGETYPFTTEYFYADSRHPDGSIKRLSHWCKECKRDYQRVGSLTAEQVAERRARKRAEDRARAQRVAKDPDARERFRAANRARAARWRSKNPERVRAARRRYEAKVRADPERYRAARERERIARRLRKERAGLPMNERTRHDRERDERLARAKLPALPAKPLADALDRIIARELGADAAGDGESQEVVAQSCGIGARQLRDWRSGGILRVQFDVADRVLTHAGLLPWDVWTDPDVLALWGL